VVIHGTGVHPNWADVIQPLRVGLTENGWHTISIQMPVLSNDATHDDYTLLFPEVPARIDAAVNYLKKEVGVTRVVLIAHSLGSSMTAYHLNRNQPEVDGFVAIGMGAGGKHPGNKAYTQIIEPGADHFFDGEEEALLNHVTNWLTKVQAPWVD